MSTELITEITTLLTQHGVNNEILTLDLAILVLEHEKSTILELTK